MTFKFVTHLKDFLCKIEPLFNFYFGIFCSIAGSALYTEIEDHTLTINSLPLWSTLISVFITFVYYLLIISVQYTKNRKSLSHNVDSFSRALTDRFVYLIENAKNVDELDAITDSFQKDIKKIDELFEDDG